MLDCGVHAEARRKNPQPVHPWPTGRTWAYACGYPGLPARLRVGGIQWQRFLNRSLLGAPAGKMEMCQLGRARDRAGGNRPSRGGSGGCISSGGSGSTLLTALADESWTTAVAQALSLADQAFNRLRALWVVAEE